MSRSKEEKRNRILQAAISVFARKGFFNSRISEISKEAKVADGGRITPPDACGERSLAIRRPLRKFLFPLPPRLFPVLGQKIRKTGSQVPTNVPHERYHGVTTGKRHLEHLVIVHLFQSGFSQRFVSLKLRTN